MAIRTDEVLLDCFLAMLGLKQGCPLSLTLFGLYTKNLEDFLWRPCVQTARLAIFGHTGGGTFIVC
jgi:hypothetical protein